MKIITLSILCFIINLFAFGQESNWTNLFDGKTLNGWKTLNGNAEFKVENGCIVGTSKKETPNSFLATENEYKNFVLEYEMKMDSGINSGVQTRSHSFDSYDKGRVHGLQVECDDSKRGWTGGLFDEARRGWRYPLEYNPAAKNAFKNNEWNKFKVIEFENHIVTIINDVVCANLHEMDAETGFIALQIHAIRDARLEGRKIYWKNIRLKTSTKSDIDKLGKISATEISYLINLLTEQEQKEGWKLLWDGKTTKGWRGAKIADFPKVGWQIKDGELSVIKSNGAESTNGGDIVTIEKYTNFILELEFKISEKANSGVKYFVNTELNKGEGSAIGCEFQFLDDKNHPDAKLGKNGNRTLGSLYDLITADAKRYNPYITTPKYFNGIDKWNKARIMVNGNKVQHILNGCLVVEYERGNQAWRDLVATSKYKDWPNFGEAKSGNILLQDHGDEVTFRSIKIKELP